MRQAVTFRCSCCFESIPQNQLQFFLRITNPSGSSKVFRFCSWACMRIKFTGR